MTKLISVLVAAVALFAGAQAAQCTPSNGDACGKDLKAQGSNCATDTSLAFITPPSWDQNDVVYPVVNGEPNAAKANCGTGRCSQGRCVGGG